MTPRSPTTTDQSTGYGMAPWSTESPPWTARSLTDGPGDRLTVGGGESREGRKSQKTMPPSGSLIATCYVQNTKNNTELMCTLPMLIPNTLETPKGTTEREVDF